jgi:hypothetical protein
MPVQEEEHEQVGFILPPEPSSEALLAVATETGERERADLESAHMPSAAQAPALCAAPAPDTAELLHDTLRPIRDREPRETIIQLPSEEADPLSSTVFPAGGVEAGYDSTTPFVTTGVTTPPRVTRSRHGSLHEPPTARDAEALKALARLRVLSYDQLRRRYYAGHPSIVGRRMQKLAKDGWVVLFMDRLTDGGPFYVFPTVKTLRWARKEFLRDEASPHRTLIETMFPNAVSTLYTPEPRTAPTFLRHHELTNDVAETLERSEALGLEWLSTWPRPFPHAYHRLALPQPDLVFVARVNGARQLFFGELDHNSNESIAHFKDRKANRAVSLAYSGFLPELTGYESFLTLVVVADTKDPLGRIGKLVEAAKSAHAADLLAFTVAPWLHKNPTGRIWFSRGRTPKSASLDSSTHELSRFEDFVRSDEAPLTHLFTTLETTHLGAPKELTN